MTLYEIHFVSGEWRTIEAETADIELVKGAPMWVFRRESKVVVRIPMSGLCYVVEANSPPWADG
jgi:hypothetical protein